MSADGHIGECRSGEVDRLVSAEVVRWTGECRSDEIGW